MPAHTPFYNTRNKGKVIDLIFTQETIIMTHNRKKRAHRMRHVQKATTTGPRAEEKFEEAIEFRPREVLKLG